MIIAVLVVALAIFVAGYNKGHLAGQRWERSLRRNQCSLIAEPHPVCGHACEWVEPYGFVPEADCPIHDPPVQYVDVDVVTRRLEPIGIATMSIHSHKGAQN